jgi:tetratricopeptide (TPR) repeat protein
MRSRTRRAFEFVFALMLVVLARRASASSCDELVRSAKAHETAGESDVALRVYNDAVRLDPTCVAAWMGLGNLRAKTGDAAEAERVFDAALSHVPSLPEAIAGRARSRWRLGRGSEAEEDMRQFVDRSAPNDPRAALAGLVELAGWYAAMNRPPAQLACWRRIAAIAHGVDDALETRAKTTVRALSIVVGDADPVTHPPRRDLLRSVAALRGN